MIWELQGYLIVATSILAKPGRLNTRKVAKIDQWRSKATAGIVPIPLLSLINPSGWFNVLLEYRSTKNMFSFNLRFGFFSLAAGSLGSRLGLLHGVALSICLLVGLPTAEAFQMPMADDKTETEETDETDLKRVDWKELSPTGSRATFKMPVKPRFVERTFTPVKGRPSIKVRLYIGSAPKAKMSFTVNYNDMAEPPYGSKGIDNTLEGVIRGSVTNVAGQLLDKKEIKLNGVRGRQFAYQFADNQDNQYVVLSRAFLKGRRIYQLTVVMDLPSYVEKEKYHEEVAALFLNSFKIVRAKHDLPPKPKALSKVK